MQKIAISGAQSSGKTTSLYYLAYKLKKRGRELGIGHETARDSPYPLNELGGPLTQLWILFRQIEKEAKLESWYDKIIFDRSVFDVIPYSAYLYRLGRMTKEDLEFIDKTAFAWAKNHPYSLVIYLEPLPREKDTARGTNTQEYQTEIETDFKKLLKRLPCPVKKVKIAPKEERCIDVYTIVRDELYPGE